MSDKLLDNNKLPLYGQLNIHNYKNFLKESKETFFEKLYAVHHSDFSMDHCDTLVTLGRGSFGTVKLVRDKNSDTYYAAKIQQKVRIKENNYVNRVFFEKRVLFSLDFPFCLRMEHYCHDADCIYFLMPFVRGGELYTLIKKFNYFEEKMSRFYAAQVVLALEFFQYIHFVYRDLKPENILLDHTGFLKITDFGLSKEVDSRTYTICGTPSYMAPEIIQGDGYARSSDWWSLGILIFEMSSGKTPFTAKNSIKLFTKIMYAPIPMYSIFSRDLKSLLRGLLNKDVTNRLGNLKNGAEDVKNHPWFKKTNWLQLLNRKVPPPYIPETSGPADTSHFPYVAHAAAKMKSSENYKKQSTKMSARMTLLEDHSKAKKDK